MCSMAYPKEVPAGIISVPVQIWDWATMWWHWIMQKKPVRWIPVIRNLRSITSVCSRGAAWADSVVRLVAVMEDTAAVMAGMAAMEITVDPLAEQVIFAVICGVQIRCVNVWEEIFADAYKKSYAKTGNGRGYGST